nr:M3 family oligoendopeptidase [Dissulfuribacter thermophilus]
MYQSTKERFSTKGQGKRGSSSKTPSFFELEWQKVPSDAANSILNNPCLKDYRHYLTFLRRFSPHTLTEAEEKILIETSPVGRSSWITLFEKVMATLEFGEEKRSQEQVLSDLYSPDRSIRIKAHKDFTQGLLTQEHVLTHCFNTVLQDKAIEDRLRKYPNWLSYMNLTNEIQDETVDVLVKCVTDHYSIVEKYYDKKRQILGLDKLYDYDRYAPIEGIPDEIIPWEEAKEIVLSAYYDFSETFGQIGERFFEERWIHAPVLPGKTSGAFSHSTVPEAHPYILVNYTGKIRDVETLAHELGHGIHQYLSRKVGYFNSHTPLPLAETASVFGEMLVFKKLLERFQDEKVRRALICEKVESIFATVFRQIAMNRFEDAIHNARRTKGELSPQEFGKFWYETQKAMFGDSVELTDEYSHWWSYISHFIHAPGYVYSYAFGELLVLSLISMFEQGQDGFVEKYIDLLSSGGKSDPYELLEPFNIDLNDTAFWNEGLKKIDEMVDSVNV